MTRVNGTDRVLTGWGRTAPSRAYVAGPMETTRLQEIIATQPARGVLARGAGAGGRVYLAKDVRMQADAFAAMYGQLAEWREVRELLDPRKVFSSDLGRRLGLC